MHMFALLFPDAQQVGADALRRKLAGLAAVIADRKRGESEALYDLMGEKVGPLSPF